MNAEFRRVKEIFLAAVEKPDPAGRSAYLHEVCGQDDELRGQVEALLGKHAQAGSFLEFPARPAATLAEAPVVERPGTVIGPYKLLQQIGEGGMGVVWMAEQTQPVQRKVALKVIKPGLDSRQVIARFEAERQALAMMDHVNIARVFDGGATDGGTTDSPLSPVLGGEGSGVRGCGRPYFVMELVHGVPITKYCDEHHLTPRQRLELFVPVCQAIQHAHQKGIIHRDIKPSNVMVTLYDGKPVPKVIDFGVAKATEQKLTERTLFTQYGTMVGTLEYMSPEQAEMSALGVDTRSDIYSLGVLLYELLTGSTPLDRKRMREAAFGEILRIIKEEEPPKPSTRLSDSGEALASISANRDTEPAKLTKLVKGELDWIVMKALEKDRTRRYETANGFAMDIERYLADEPVQACPPSAGYRLRKFVQRNRGPVLAAALVVLALVGGIIGTTWGMFRASHAEAEAVAEAKLKERERDKAVEASDRAARAEIKTKRQLFDARLAQARASRSSRQVGQRYESWQALSEAAALSRELGLSDTNVLDLRSEAIACLALANLRVIKEWEGFPPGSGGHLGFDADLEHYACSDQKGNISIRRVSDDQEVSRLPGQGPGGFGSGATGPRFSPDGKLLAVANYHRLPGQPTNFQLWDWRRQTSVFQPSFAVGERALAFSPDGRQLALGQPNGTLTIHNVPTGQEVQRINLGSTPWAIAFHPDGSRVAVASVHGREVQVRDTASGNLVQRLPTPEAAWSVAWHPEGVLLAAGCNDTQVYLWETASWRQHSVLKGHQSAVHLLAFAPGGDVLASSSWDSTSRLWDAWAGCELMRLPGGSASFFKQDGRRLACQSGTMAAVLEVEPAREWRTLPRSLAIPKEEIGAGGFSPDGRWLAVNTSAGVRLWDLPSRKERAFLPVTRTQTVQFHPSGRELFMTGPAGLFRWPMHMQDSSLQIGPARKVPGPDPGPGSWFANFSLDRQGQTLAVFESGSPRGWVLDLDNLRDNVLLLGHEQVNNVAISPDGRWVAAGVHEGSGVRVWDARTGKVVHHLAPDERFAIVAFSPDSRWLVTGLGTAFDIWETHATDPWKVAWHIGREQASEHAGRAAFTPDGQVLAITISPSVVQLFDAATRRPLARLQSPDPDPISWLAFSPDGSQLVVTTQAKPIRLWDLRLVREQLQTIGLDWDRPQYLSAQASGNAKPVTVEVHLGDLEPERVKLREYLRAVEANANDARANNNLAWLRATCADLQLRDAKEAVVQASKAVQLAPKNGNYWNTLGVAQYRAGDWKAAIHALEKAMELRAPDSFDWFFLAMACWQQSDTEKAHAWYDKANQWMEKNKPNDNELRRFRAEAESLLNRTGKPMPK